MALASFLYTAMALARAGSLILRQQAYRPLLQTRLSSSHADDSHHHHGAHHDGSSQGQELTFPKEDFSSSAWAKAAVVALGVVGFYKYAPTPEEDNYVSRVLSHYQTPSEYWREINKNNLGLFAMGQMEELVIADAKKPPVHRYRYPQSLEQYSPHLHAVGKSVDLSNVVVKSDK